MMILILVVASLLTTFATATPVAKPELSSERVITADVGNLIKSHDLILGRGETIEMSLRAETVSHLSVLSPRNYQSDQVDGDLFGNSPFELRIDLDREQQEKITRWIESSIAPLPVIEEHLFARGWAPFVVKLLPECNITTAQLQRWISDLRNHNLDFNDFFHAIGGDKLAVRLAGTDGLDVDKAMAAVEQHLGIDQESAKRYLKDHSFRMSETEKQGDEGKYRTAYFFKIFLWNSKRDAIKVTIRNLMKGGFADLLGGTS